MPHEITVIFRGEKELQDALITSVASANAATRRIVERGSLLMLSEAKRTFRKRPGGQITAKSGRTYYSFKPPYNAVPPQPTSRSGALAGSLGTVYQISPVGADGWIARFGTKFSYAAAVEHGTRYMAKEP